MNTINNSEQGGRKVSPIQKQITNEQLRLILEREEWKLISIDYNVFKKTNQQKNDLKKHKRDYANMMFKLHGIEWKAIVRKSTKTTVLLT